MTHRKTIQHSIEASLDAMHRLLVAATEEVNAARQDMNTHGQNAAIGALLTVEERLNQAMALYQAIVALHRSKL